MSAIDALALTAAFIAFVFVLILAGLAISELVWTFRAKRRRRALRRSRLGS
jgi:hypothetical protein